MATSMTESLILTILIGTPLLYSIGGMVWKPARRFGIPFLFLVVALLAHLLTWQIGLMCLALCVALHLGYGDHSNWFMRIVYALAITAPSLIVRFNFWAIILPIVFLGTYYLSNRPKWQSIFNWRICEAIVGFFMGILYSQVLGG
jgi:hypothetical protein